MAAFLQQQCGIVLGFERADGLGRGQFAGSCRGAGEMAAGGGVDPKAML